MAKSLKYGGAVYHYGDYDLQEGCTPSPVMKLRSIQIRGKKYNPNLGDRTILLLLQRKMEKKVSFSRAYTGWREGGSREEHELGEGRAFLRWIQRHELGISWEEGDIALHPYFIDDQAPRHNPQDETAKGMHFAIAPIEVNGRRIKLYVEDQDMLRIIHTPYGRELDFGVLLKKYLMARLKWLEWQAPAPTLMEWLRSTGHKPLFSRGQLGFCPPLVT